MIAANLSTFTPFLELFPLFCFPILLVSVHLIPRNSTIYDRRVSPSVFHVSLTLSWSSSLVPLNGLETTLVYPFKLRRRRHQLGTLFQ
jgi:hypothetical protein